MKKPRFDDFELEQVTLEGSETKIKWKYTEWFGNIPELQEGSIKLGQYPHQDFIDAMMAFKEFVIKWMGFDNLKTPAYEYDFTDEAMIANKINDKVDILCSNMKMLGIQIKEDKETNDLNVIVLFTYKGFKMKTDTLYVRLHEPESEFEENTLNVARDNLVKETYALLYEDKQAQQKLGVDNEESEEFCDPSTGEMLRIVKSA